MRIMERIDPKFYFFLDYKPDKPIPEVPTTLGFAFSHQKVPLSIRLVLPYWSLVIVAGGFGAMPWIRRFSLRTLLIATTLVAVVLGLIVAVFR